jgi:erythromycin esterase-like protein
VPVTRALPIDLDGEHGDLAPFSVLDDLADRARVAYIVEMDHFIHEKYDFRLLCIRYLASRGWRWFGEELDWRQGERVDRYLATGDERLLDPIEEPDWYTSGALRQAVDRHPKAAFDAEQRRFAQAVRRAVPDARWFGFDIGGADEDYLKLANAARTLDELPPAMALRERLIHERVARFLRDHPDEKVALMAGSLHLMKDDDRVQAPGVIGPGGDTDASVGHHVVHELGEGPVLSIWLLHGRGTSANPWLTAPGELSPQPGTLDAEFAQRWDRPCLVRVDDDDAERRVTQMHNQVMTCRLSEQVDAVVFAPEVSPIRER